MFDRLYNGNRQSSIEANLFVSMAFEKLQQEQMDYEFFASIIILHPPITNFFRLDMVAE
jgi:hypothetical protein